MAGKRLWVTLKNGERYTAAEVDIAYDSLRDLENEANDDLRLLCGYAKGEKQLTDVPVDVAELFQIPHNAPVWQVAKSILLCTGEDGRLIDPYAYTSETDVSIAKGKAVQEGNAKRLLDGIQRPDNAK